MQLNNPEQVEDCGNCGESVPLDTESVLYCSEDGTPGEGPVCPACLDRPDADTCLKCGGVWWTGVTPPYTEENSPGTVCDWCFHQTVGGDD